MKRGLNISLIICLLITTLSFKSSSEANDYGVKIQKSITQVKEHLYQVLITIENADQANGFARYEAKLPITADFVKEISRDKVVNFKMDGRKMKLLWMHFQKGRKYNTIFQIKSKLPMDKLKMTGNFSSHVDGQLFSVEDSSEFVSF